MKFDLNHSIILLGKTPKILIEMLQGLPNEWTHNNEGGYSWSPYDIVGHFIHGEKTDWIPRAQIILSTQKDKTFIPFDRFAQFENSKGKSLDQILKEFQDLRLDNISTLKSFNLNEEKLNRIGFHPEFGEVTLKQLLATWTAHDLVHINQMSRVMAKNYQHAIGPWRNYIKLLR